jgi:AcrR family transcriptional regulator
MNAKSPKNPELTRHDLLQAAFDEIHEHGFQGANLDRILKNTRVTKGALYHHFPSKHALGLAVVDEVIAPRIFENRVTPLAGGDDPVTAILAAARHEIECLTEEQCERGCPLNNLIQEMSPLDAEFRSHLHRIVERWSHGLSEALRRGQARGNVRADLNCEGAALFIIAVYTGVVGLAKLMDVDTVHALTMEQANHYLNSLRP